MIIETTFDEYNCNVNYFVTEMSATNKGKCAQNHSKY